MQLHVGDIREDADLDLGLRRGAPRGVLPPRRAGRRRHLGRRAGLRRRGERARDAAAARGRAPARGAGRVQLDRRRDLRRVRRARRRRPRRAGRCRRTAPRSSPPRSTWRPGTASTARRHVALRFANVYGPHQAAGLEGGVVAIFLERMAEGATSTIFGDGSQTRDFVYVGDVVRAVLAAAGHDGGVFNVGTGTETSVSALYDACGRVAGFDASRRSTRPPAPATSCGACSTPRSPPRSSAGGPRRASRTGSPRPGAGSGRNRREGAAVRSEKSPARWSTPSPPPSPSGPGGPRRSSSSCSPSSSWLRSSPPGPPSSVRPSPTASSTPPAQQVFAPIKAVPLGHQPKPGPPTLSRRQTSILVLNGNGRAGRRRRRRGARARARLHRPRSRQRAAHRLRPLDRDVPARLPRRGAPPRARPARAGRLAARRPPPGASARREARVVLGDR